MTTCSFGNCKRKPTEKTENERKSRYLCGCLVNVIILILVGFAVAAFNIRIYTGSRNFYSFHKGDQISIHKVEAEDFSTVLCQKYDVAPWTKANIYLLHSEAKVDKHHKNEVKKQLVHGTIIADNSYNYDGFYLLKHSEIFVSACMIPSKHSDVEMDVLLFKGRESWTTWQENKECRDCPIMTLSLGKKDMCRENFNRTMKYKVHHTGSYYVVVARKYNRDLHKTVNLNVDLLVKRTTYKLDHIKEFCPDSLKCTLNLTYASEEDVVVDIQDDVFSPEAFFTTRCHMRVMFWIGIFAILPALLIFILVSCCCCFAACGRRNSGENKVQPTNYNDKAVLVINEQLPQQQPPTYQEVTEAQKQVV